MQLKITKNHIIMSNVSYLSCKVVGSSFTSDTKRLDTKTTIKKDKHITVTMALQTNSILQLIH